MQIHRAHSLLAMLAVVMLAGCTALPRNPVPVEDMHRAEVPGMPPVRARAGHLDPDFQADLVLSVKQEPPGAFPQDASGYPFTTRWPCPAVVPAALSGPAS